MGTPARLTVGEAKKIVMVFTCACLLSFGFGIYALEQAAAEVKHVAPTVPRSCAEAVLDDLINLRSCIAELKRATDNTAFFYYLSDALSVVREISREADRSPMILPSYTDRIRQVALTEFRLAVNGTLTGVISSKRERRRVIKALEQLADTLAELRLAEEPPESEAHTIWKT